MTFTQYKIEGVRVSCKNAKSGEVLETCLAESFGGVLLNLQQLAANSFQVFQNIQNEIAGDIDRIKGCTARYTRLKDTILNKPYEKLATCRTRRMEKYKNISNIFLKESRPPTLGAMYEKATPKPNFSGLPGDEDYGKKFSNPNFFIEQFVKMEMEKLEKEEAEAKVRKEKRDKKKKKKKLKQKRHVVKAEEVHVKVYSAMGQEFQDQVPQRVSSQPTQTRTPTNRETAPYNPPQNKSINEVPENVPPLPNTTQISHQGLPSTNAPLPPSVPAPPSSVPQPPVRAPVAPPINSSITQSYRAAPVPPPPNTGVPVPPPVAPTMRAAPPPPTPSSGPAPGNRLDLLSQIRGGAQLKQVEHVDPPPRADDPKSSLLAAIRTAKKSNLRRVEIEEKKPIESAGGGVMAEAVAMILQRRKAIQDSDSEESDDDEEWDD